MTGILGSSSSLRGVPVLGAGRRTRCVSAPELHLNATGTCKRTEIGGKLPLSATSLPPARYPKPLDGVDEVHGEIEVDGSGLVPPAAGHRAPPAARPRTMYRSARMITSSGGTQPSNPKASNCPHNAWPGCAKYVQSATVTVYCLGLSSNTNGLRKSHQETTNTTNTTLVIPARTRGTTTRAKA
jgi:hypothetical protein